MFSTGMYTTRRYIPKSKGAPAQKVNLLRVVLLSTARQVLDGVEEPARVDVVREQRHSSRLLHGRPNPRQRRLAVCRRRRLSRMDQPLALLTEVG